ncbi:uncharacterized protein SCODWIG_02952 [Saccharomycodes ludwigii]|uniref:E3 ubiquitin protein ligase n=1 Tax=Saccharomycodes ludwigii TaxID=36035 RepID=A0A376B994_9ASCO|nr:uncharacterized protein SCODWIG_02952 [Saccharomycodes ludwigii]
MCPTSAHDHDNRQEGPAKKKIKLSPMDEPLTRLDIIYFQKDALYRRIKDCQVKYNSLTQQYQVLSNENSNLISKLSLLYTFYYKKLTSANLAHVNGTTPSADKTLQDATAITSDNADKDLEEFLKSNESSIRDLLINNISPDANEISSSTFDEKRKTHELVIKNTELNKELSYLKKYYESIIHKYERDSSEVVRRIFKITKEEDKLGQQQQHALTSVNNKIKSELPPAAAAGIDPVNINNVSCNNNDNHNNNNNNNNNNINNYNNNYNNNNNNNNNNDNNTGINDNNAIETTSTISNNCNSTTGTNNNITPVISHSNSSTSNNNNNNNNNTQNIVTNVQDLDATNNDASVIPVNHSNGNFDIDPKKLQFNRMNYELQIEELSTKIAFLEKEVAELSTLKKKNELDISKMTNTIQNMNLGATSYHNKVVFLTNKIDSLLSKNDELNSKNKEYLNKFNQLYQEREVYNNKITESFEKSHENLKKHNAQLEKDLVRIRTIRDELLSKISILEAEKSKDDLLNDLTVTIDGISKQLTKLEQFHSVGNTNTESNSDALLKELQDLENAYKELAGVSAKKYQAYINHESILGKLNVEKTKADQKYFTAMRSKDSILIENKNLSKSLNKSNEMILQLREMEKVLQTKIDNLNKQLNFSRENESRLLEGNKKANVKLVDLQNELTASNNRCNSLDSELGRVKEVADGQGLEINDLKTKLKEEKVTIQTLEAKYDKVYTALKQLLSEDKTKLKKEHTTNGNAKTNFKESFNTVSSLTTASNEPVSVLEEELDNFRNIVYCSLCSKNWKNTAIKTCGHVFCEECCKERLAARMRKCPTCNKGFSSNDLLLVHL